MIRLSSFKASVLRRNAARWLSVNAAWNQHTTVDIGPGEREDRARVYLQQVQLQQEKPLAHRDADHIHAFSRMRNDRHMGVLRQGKDDQPFFTEEDSDPVSTPHLVADALEHEKRDGLRAAMGDESEREILTSFFPGADPTLTEFGDDRQMIIEYNLMGDRDNKNPNAGRYLPVNARAQPRYAV